MTRIDFYILQAGNSSNARLRFLSRLVEKLYRDNYRLHVHAENQAMLQQIDNLLWSARDISFIPHEISDTPLPHCPVTLGNQYFSGTDEILVNLDRKAPEFFSQFTRVVEIIDSCDDTCTRLGRDRYRFYRDRGYPLNNHMIDNI